MFQNATGLHRVLAIAAVAVLPLKALAAEISDDTLVYEWEDPGPYVFQNITPQVDDELGGEPVCLDFEVTCTEHFFSIDQSTEFVDADNDFVLISIGWASEQGDFDPYLYDADTGDLLVNGAGSANPDRMFVPVRDDGTFNGNYRVVVVPFTPIAEGYYGHVQYHDFEGGAKAKASAELGSVPFDVFNPPSPFTGYSADEPTMGIDRTTNKTYMIYNSDYLETAFDDSTSPATATWADVTGNGRPLIQADPFMTGDEHPLPDGSWSSRIWAVGFGLAVSDMLFSDEPGSGVWTRANTAAAGLPAGVDNESIASGPYPEGLVFDELRVRSEVSGGKGHAFYYCAHAAANAFCIRSDDGGLSYNTGRAIFPMTSTCNNHGHVKVGPDGTVYVPMNNACQGGQGVTVSLDAGETWTYIRVPGPSSTGSGRWDANIAIANDGETLYFGFNNSITDDPMVVKGKLSKVPDAATVSGLRPEIEWGEPVNVGLPEGLRNATFPTMVAGDPDRAAFAFHGSADEGDSGAPEFDGTWYLYVATTYDGGETWQLNNVQPSDPTQKGGFCDRGISCPSSPPYRNLLDFMDMAIDRDGRVVVGHADGCVRSCTTEGGRASYSDMGGLARQAGGLPMYSAFDEMFVGKSGDGMAPKAAVPTAIAKYNTIHLSWKPPYDGGQPIQGYRIFRSLDGNTASLLTTMTGGYVSDKPYFVDRSAQPGLTYAYQVQAWNAVGDSALSPVVTASFAHALNVASGTVEDNDRPTQVNDAKAEDAESECVPPGITVVEDGSNDPLTGPPEGQDVSEDIQWIAVAEPGNLEDTIVFTLKVESLPEPDLPQHRWVVYFTVPDGTEWYAAMSNAEGVLRYEYGLHVPMDTPAATVGQFQYEGDLEEGSGHDNDGTITLVLKKSSVGGMNPGDEIFPIYAKVRASSPNEGASNSGITRDDTGQGGYDVVGNESCAAKQLTVASFDVSQKTGPAPMTVTFDATPTVLDSGVSVKEYRWNFGDGSDPVVTTEPRVTHTYTNTEAFRPKLRVLDSRDRLSNTAKAMLLVGADPAVTASGGYSIFGGGFGGSALLALAGLAALRRRR